MTVGELASWSALAAIATLVVSGLTIVLFFGGAGAFWGPVNDVFVALTALLLVLPLVAVWRLAPDDIGPWFGALTLLGIVGLVVIAVGQLALVAGAIDLNASFVTGGLGIAPVVIWAVAFSYLIFARGIVSIEVGWLLVATLGVAALAAASGIALPTAVTASASVVLLALLVAWLGVLSREVRVVV